MASGTCRYSLECSPLGYSKWPLRKAPVSRRTRTTSSCVGNRCMLPSRLPTSDFCLLTSDFCLLSSVFCLLSSAFSVRPVPGKDAGNGAQNDFPIQRQRPVIDVLHIHAHPGLEVQIIAAGHRPQTG